MTGAVVQTGSCAGSARGETWVRSACAMVVAGVAAYSSYAHQRQFALDGGADAVTAAVWPLSVDGLVILASIGLLRQSAETARRARWAVRWAFLLGVAVSLAANVAAAPSLAWQPVLVAGWPPLALLLAVELVMHSRHRDPPVETETATRPAALDLAMVESAAGPNSAPVTVADRGGGCGEARTAEAVMWAYYERELACGRRASGAELDRIAGTNNYGRAVLARWRRTGRLPQADAVGEVAADAGRNGRQTVLVDSWPVHATSAGPDSTST